MELIKSSQIKERHLNSNKSKSLILSELINSNPNLMFDNNKICQLYNSKYTDKLELNRSSTIITRLFRKGMLLRTKTQLKDGYIYSLSNNKEINKLYNIHLLPYNFADKQELINTIIRSQFDKLLVNHDINKSKTKEYVPNLLEFLNQVRAMLNHFGIQTSHIQLRKQEKRAFSGRFYIKGKENLKRFYDKIGFLYASKKQNVLESLIVDGKS